jgi:hypothetical protein
MKQLSVGLQFRLVEFLKAYLVDDDPPCKCLLCVQARGLLVQAEDEYRSQS